MLNQDKYSDEILSLADKQEEFVESITNGALFFEAPAFSKVDIQELKSFIESEFEVQISEPIKIKRETFQYIKDKCGVDLPIPDTDMIYEKVFTSNTYMLKLMQLAESKLTCRDFGGYSSVTRQPLKDREGNNTGSRLGKNILLSIKLSNSVKVLLIL